MARVRGKSLSATLINRPGVLSSSTWPPRLEVLFLTTSMPTPRPETSLTVTAVERPGKKDELQLLLHRHLFDGAGGHQPLGHRLAGHGHRIDAPAVIADGDMDQAAFVKGLHPDGAGCRLPIPDPFRLCFKAVVAAVADEMGKGVREGFDVFAL
jgi:hypothetical protein